MRISVKKDDPGYSPLCRHAIVYLDGAQQHGCITADSDEGWLIRYRRDARGNLVCRFETIDLVAVRNEIVVEICGHWETERVEGRVEIFINQ